MTRRNTAAFDNINPAVAAKMAALREEDETQKQPETVSSENTSTYIMTGTYTVDTTTVPIIPNVGYTYIHPDPVRESLEKELALVKAERDKALAQIVILRSRVSTGGLNHDGSLTILVTIPEDTVLALAPWQENEGTSMVEVIEKYVPIALEAYINGGG